MNFLESILQDLDEQDIEYDEHYDPGGMKLYFLNLRKHANPTLSYSYHNPNHVLLSIFVPYSSPLLAELEETVKFRKVLNLKELGLQIGLDHKIGIQMDVFHASVGIMFEAHEYNKYKFLTSLPIVMNAYDKFFELAVDILHQE